jgi:hypothetical protein
MSTPNHVEPCDPPFGHIPLKKDLRLNAWLAVATLLYGAMLFLVKRHPDWTPLVRGLLQLSALLPAMFYIRSWMRFVRSLDELQRAIQLEALLFAALGTVVVGSIVTTLNASGIDLGGLKHGLGLGGAYFAMFALWLVGGGIATRRYR